MNYHDISNISNIISCVGLVVNQVDLRGQLGRMQAEDIMIPFKLEEPTLPTPKMVVMRLLQLTGQNALVVKIP